MTQFFFPVNPLVEKVKFRPLRYFMVGLIGTKTEKNYSIGLIISPKKVASFRQLTRKQIEVLTLDTVDKLTELAEDRSGVPIISVWEDLKEFYECNDYVLQQIKKGEDGSFRVSYFQEMEIIKENY